MGFGLYRVQIFNSWWTFHFFQLHITSSDITLLHPTSECNNASEIKPCSVHELAQLRRNGLAIGTTAVGLSRRSGLGLGWRVAYNHLCGTNRNLPNPNPKPIKRSQPLYCTGYHRPSSSRTRVSFRTPIWGYPMRTSSFVTMY